MVQYDCEILLDRYGAPDVDYYVKEAKRLRALAVSQLIHGVGEWLKAYLEKWQTFPFRPSL